MAIKKAKKVDYELEYSKVRPFFTVQFGPMTCNEQTEVLFSAKSLEEKENIIDAINNNINDYTDGSPGGTDFKYSVPAISIINVNEYTVFGVKVVINDKEDKGIDKINLKAGEYVVITDTSMAAAVSGSADDPIDFPYNTIDIYLTTVRREQIKLSYKWNREEKRFDYNKENSIIGNKIDIDKEIYKANQSSNTYTFGVKDIDCHSEE
ncbi:hypothetical protein P7H70_13875 [Vagococcus carniphilus]|uniref:Uncharacterized protein n=1 Tax=Vagococcus carniphilus TaxID=218144 RepID=A0AAW8U7P8_9ENTE|nr:hypothetical protein [Vagococcus carniphilus]MDT2835124.1 hypothetical protein [Vagococcus carniphilus]